VAGSRQGTRVARPRVVARRGGVGAWWCRWSLVRRDWLHCDRLELAAGHRSHGGKGRRKRDGGRWWPRWFRSVLAAEDLAQRPVAASRRVGAEGRTVQKGVVEGVVVVVVSSGEWLESDLWGGGMMEGWRDGYGVRICKKGNVPVNAGYSQSSERSDQVGGHYWWQTRGKRPSSSSEGRSAAAAGRRAGRGGDEVGRVGGSRRCRDARSLRSWPSRNGASRAGGWLAFLSELCKRRYGRSFSGDSTRKEKETLAAAAGGEKQKPARPAGAGPCSDKPDRMGGGR
jgi:hypothetical protein